MTTFLEPGVNPGMDPAMRDMIAAYTPQRQAYLDCLANYQQGELGMHQASQPLRYDRFFEGYEGYDRAAILEDLGRDVDPVEHMPETEEIFLELVTAEALTSKDRAMGPEDVYEGGLVLVSHDVGENTHPSFVKRHGAVVGDIPQGEKRDHHRVIEALIWQDIFDGYFAGAISQERHNRIKALVFHHEHSHLHSAIEAAHDTGSFRVGLCAGRLALSALKDGDTNNDRFTVLRHVGVEVSTNSIARMERHARQFVLPSKELDAAESLYDEIMIELR